tara:strand:- start:6875 stop:7579 length:705 start_codon:yes stop_codon:yes gene_type:complete
MIIELFGDSFIYGIGSDKTKDDKLTGIDYHLTNLGWSVSNHAQWGCNNSEIVQTINDIKFEQECYVVVGITSLLRENLPFLGFASSWGRNILKEDKGDHPNLTNPMDNRLWEDYLVHGYDTEYFNTLYKLLVLKIRNQLNTDSNVKGYILVNTVEAYKKPKFEKNSNYLYIDESITDMLLNTKDYTYFERGLNTPSHPEYNKNWTEPFVKGRSHPSTKGYELVAKDIHDILHNA